MDASVSNAMTVDVEDYFQVSAFEPYIAKDRWDSLPHRVERNTQQILDIFAEQKIVATFFVLGWVAERYPDLIRRIVGEGHELASHGWEHIRATEQTPEQFREDIHKTKLCLEDLCGVAVKGYRAASYSIMRDNWWALEVLEEEGYLYSSSVYPVKHDLYGVPDASRFAFHPNREGGLLEIPVSTLPLFGRNFPCGGGGFFRLYPYFLSRWMILQINQKEKAPCVFYFHPWEIDPDQPRQPGLNVKTKFRHYLNLHRMGARLQKLIEDFRWQRMDNLFLNQS